MKNPQPVTDEDVRAFWDALYTATVAGHEYPARPPKNDYFDQHLLGQIRIALVGDRKRVATRSEA